MKVNISWLKILMGITIFAVIGVGAILLTALVVSFNAQNSIIESKFDIIDQKLDSQKEINSLQKRRRI